jgi:hypothetical protein
MLGVKEADEIVRPATSSNRPPEQRNRKLLASINITFMSFLNLSIKRIQFHRKNVQQGDWEIVTSNANQTSVVRIASIVQHGRFKNEFSRESFAHDQAPGSVYTLL